MFSVLSSVYCVRDVRATQIPYVCDRVHAFVPESLCVFQCSFIAEVRPLRGHVKQCSSSHAGPPHHSNARGCTLYDFCEIVGSGIFGLKLSTPCASSYLRLLSCGSHIHKIALSPVYLRLLRLAIRESFSARSFATHIIVFTHT